MPKETGQSQSPLVLKLEAVSVCTFACWKYVTTFLRCPACFRFQKPLLDEQRVDYVQVDEKKTQALQNTRTEWKDSRQPKV